MQYVTRLYLTAGTVGTDDKDLGDDDDDDEPLNSDDDDEEDSEDALQTDNLVLCQYDKVTRTKNKWKAQLKSGVSFLCCLYCALYFSAGVCWCVLSWVVRNSHWEVTQWVGNLHDVQVMTLNHADGRKQDFIFHKATADMNFAN